MRIHHLNCGTMCPFGGALYDGFSRGLTAKLVCHCLLIETNQGLVLVDTGFGEEDIKHPHERLSNFFLYFNNIKLRRENTAYARILELGLDPFDVRHIVLTHLDFDHAGGLSDFPHARVHLLADELNAAKMARTWKERSRFRRPQWDTEMNWTTYAAEGERWYGFDCVRQLKGLPPEILLVPLVGHTLGHAGVAVRDGSGWLLHAGDAYFYRGEMDPHHYRCTPGLRFYQTMMEADRKQRHYNQDRLRELARMHGHEVKLFSSHDAIEFEQLASRGKIASSSRAAPRPSPEISWH